MNRRASRSRRDPSGGAPAGLPREARRLLKGLAAPGGEARVDRADPARLALRTGGGVSLGGGTFARAAGELLVRHDLAA